MSSRRPPGSSWISAPPSTTALRSSRPSSWSWRSTAPVPPGSSSGWPASSAWPPPGRPTLGSFVTRPATLPADVRHDPWAQEMAAVRRFADSTVVLAANPAGAGIPAREPPGSRGWWLRSRCAMASAASCRSWGRRRSSVSWPGSAAPAPPRPAPSSWTESAPCSPPATTSRESSPPPCSPVPTARRPRCSSAPDGWGRRSATSRWSWWCGCPLRPLRAGPRAGSGPPSDGPSAGRCRPWRPPTRERWW